MISRPVIALIAGLAAYPLACSNSELAGGGKTKSQAGEKAADDASTDDGDDAPDPGPGGTKDPLQEDGATVEPLASVTVENDASLDAAVDQGELEPASSGILTDCGVVTGNDLKTSAAEFLGQKSAPSQKNHAGKWDGCFLAYIGFETVGISGTASCAESPQGGSVWAVLSTGETGEIPRDCAGACIALPDALKKCDEKAPGTTMAHFSHEGTTAGFKKLKGDWDTCQLAYFGFANPNKGASGSCFVTHKDGAWRLGAIDQTASLTQACKATCLRFPRKGPDTPQGVIAVKSKVTFLGTVTEPKAKKIDGTWDACYLAYHGPKGAGVGNASCHAHEKDGAWWIETTGDSGDVARDCAASCFQLER